jgi:hypothetical protein
MVEAVMLIRPPFLYLILLVASLCFISLGISVTSSTGKDLTYCVIMLHYDKVDYAEVIYCPNQVPDESVYSGSLEECRKWADGFNDTE